MAQQPVPKLRQWRQAHPHRPGVAGSRAVRQRSIAPIARLAFRDGMKDRAAGPFVSEALRLMNSVDEALSKLMARGYPLVTQAQAVHEG